MQLEVEPSFSIGQVANVIGLSVFTLRQWERRYGAPFSQKLGSGHRRFSAKEVRRLKLVKHAINAGAKPHDYVAASYSELSKFVRSHGDENAIRLLATEQIVETLLIAASDFRADEFIEVLSAQWQVFGALSFISEIIGPLMVRVGEDWQCAKTSTAQEQFISQLLMSFLSAKWLALNKGHTGQPFILSTLPEELHCLGLHLCAVALTAFGKNVIFLGNSTPIDQVVSTAKSTKAAAVCLSISAYSSSRAERLVGEVVTKLTKRIPVIVGGGGSPVGLPGTYSFRNLSSFTSWLAEKCTSLSEGAAH